jgi:hypothetical protein
VANSASLSIEYRARAIAEIAAGMASRLEQVRSKHHHAADVWTRLADAEDARRADRDARVRSARGVPTTEGP